MIKISIGESPKFSAKLFTHLLIFCSILEAISEIENIKKIKIKKKFIKQNRVGDHIWYITDNKKFKKDYPNWKQKYNTKKIIKELIINS